MPNVLRDVRVKIKRDAPHSARIRFGESFYAFLPRCVGGSFLSAWRLETERLCHRNLPFYHNEMLW